ncbi:hypothetical protein [Pseudonocardia broussonetiae]|uniref:Uncharacterized protein n=1 Tax=Pseudonocardia broussonetiae TaxID=2736640 RepID=A0A6M6JFC7_9PSEU|nr:hypothetical protein [Pseudonocardia broussonetiae]QJY46688.1 hypothetical protein HOP40_13370 [Pseudonocardia broussonetiae]
MTAVRDLNTDDRARLAALPIEQVGMAAVDRMRDGITVLPPDPGVAVLGCGICGRVVDLASLVRVERQFVAGPPVSPIACRSCASCR